MEKPEDLLFQRYSNDKSLDKTRSKTARVSYGMSPQAARITYGDKRWPFRKINLKVIVEDKYDE